MQFLYVNFHAQLNFMTNIVMIKIANCFYTPIYKCTMRESIKIIDGGCKNVKINYNYISTVSDKIIVDNFQLLSNWFIISCNSNDNKYKKKIYFFFSFTLYLNIHHLFIYFLFTSHFGFYFFHTLWWLTSLIYFQTVWLFNIFFSPAIHIIVEILKI